MHLNKAVADSRSVALPFAVGLFFYTVIGSGIYLALGKEGAHEFLNSYHTPYLDQAFKYLTHVGHGLVPVIAFLLLLLARYSWALGMGVSSLAMAVVVQGLKRSVFAGDHRPAMFFKDGGLPAIEGVELMLHHSFPSGHSATAFCICLMFAFIIKQKWATFFLLILALLIAFSRVYISQHFIQDTIVGGWIGFFMAYLGYLFIVHAAEVDPDSKLNKRLWPS